MTRLFDKVLKLLQSQNYILEIIGGSTIYTLNCTIEVSKKEITVNEKPVQLDQVLSAVSEAEEKHGKLINLKCHYDNGSTTLKRFNGTEQAANNYFVDTIFDISSRMDEDDFHTCIRIEIQ
jgi:hypothetical protein